MNTFEDRHVLVTGAYRGIGAACAVPFAEAGARVACADIRKPDDTVVALRPRANGARHSAVVCGVSDQRSVDPLFDNLRRCFWTLDLLVHCAGVIHEAPLAETDATAFDLGTAEMSPDWRARELDIPLARFVRPDEIAAMAVFLAGPGAGFVTGQGIGVNGGSAMP
jgi:NAD(P)-dependent dehydrogenase (short-subunit alcohol dehydrogenase family)